MTQKIWIKGEEGYMMLEGEAYSRRLEEFSDSTMQLIIEIDSTSEVNARKCDEITANSELTEAEVVEQLIALKNSK